MNVVIETDRLLLRKFSVEDAEWVLLLNSDPGVTRFTGDPIRDITHAREVLETTIITQYEANGFGRWAVHLKPGHEFIGWCGLKFRPERNEIDLGYRFLPASWGKGYATEAANACISHGFRKLGLNRIVAHSMPANLGSIRVLEKCGMRYLGEQLVDNHMAATYEILNPSISG